uniref:Uncharacterized protein n=1 Tax=Timema tahoe TaxID=61484 RepID=A0A7R9FI29_9NEOP|nr:unnamed protein product [Timema tahoe]
MNSCFDTVATGSSKTSSSTVDTFSVFARGVGAASDMRQDKSFSSNATAMLMIGIQQLSISPREEN